jgi:DNA-binding MarR family transcriptional regulator
MTEKTIDEEMFNSLQRLFAETVLLFFRLTIVADQIHGKGTGTSNISAGRRGILRELYSAGPRTIPQIARSRPVTRQLIQSLVKGLMEDKLVLYIPNPVHKRSHLVALTKEGKTAVEEMTSSELNAFGGLAFDKSSEEIVQGAEIMRSVRQLFESSEWEQRLNELGEEKVESNK